MTDNATKLREGRMTAVDEKALERLVAAIRDVQITGERYDRAWDGAKSPTEAGIQAYTAARIALTEAHQRLAEAATPSALLALHAEGNAVWLRAKTAESRLDEVRRIVAE